MKSRIGYHRAILQALAIWSTQGSRSSEKGQGSWVRNSEWRQGKLLQGQSLSDTRPAAPSSSVPQSTSCCSFPILLQKCLCCPSSTSPHRLFCLLPPFPLLMPWPSSEPPMPSIIGTTYPHASADIKVLSRLLAHLSPVQLPSSQLSSC